ncbi:MAG: hypothetical protein IH945_08135 [Armatimonadetes bacterium]|nr:hypothetical protein [Armatimonadota bacterium]
MLIALAVATALGTQGSVELYRQWQPHETLVYEVRTSLLIESRHYMTTIYIPDDLEHFYKFTMAVGDVTSEGFAEVDYTRPTIDVTEGETVESPPVTTVEELNEHYTLTMSPVNAITGLKDLTPKKEDDGDGRRVRLLSLGERLAREIQDPVDDYVGDLYRLALFIGNVDTAIDFGPRLPLFEIEPGEEWHVTASYQPKRLKGKPGKMAPQRLDYTYTYVGVQESDGKKIHRVTADLELDTDIAPYINDLMGMDAAESGLRGLHLKLTAHIDFDLDFETKHTLVAIARSQGELTIEITEIPTVPLVEQKLRGRTMMRIVSRKKT